MTAARRTNLLIDQDEIDARVGTLDLESFVFDLESLHAESDDPLHTIRCEDPVCPSLQNVPVQIIECV